MEVSEIKALMKALDKTTDVDKIKGILDQFDAGVKPTEKLLRETKLGIAVNKLRTHEDAEVSEKVKKVIKKWKDEVSAQKARSKASAASSAASTKSASPSSTNGNKPDSSGGETVAAKFTSHGKPRNAKNDGVRTDIYDDKARNSCVDICYTALATDSEAAPADILAYAKSIEKVVFEGEKGTTATYRAKMRSLYMNLKDKHNPRLRQGVVNGDISAERLYKMSPQEMASDDLKKEIEELEKKNLFNARGATEKRAVTNRFTCGKCKQKKVSYYQMQTRSADEPLTTFCTCENCGNRWKFS